MERAGQFHEDGTANDGSPNDVAVYDGYGALIADVSTLEGTARFGYPSESAYTVGYGGQWGYYADPATRQNSGDSGFLLCTHRWYDPINARWLTRDPIGYDGGIGLYIYCGGNPISLVDPSGLWETGTYFGDVGQIFLGYWDVAVGIVTSPYNLAKFAGTYADDPKAGARALGSGIYHSYTDAILGVGSLRNQGASIGNIILTLAPAAKRIPSFRAAPAVVAQVVQNRISGAAFEAAALNAAGITKNTASLVGRNLRGVAVTTIPDGLEAVALTEVKSHVTTVSYTSQLQAQVSIAQARGVPLNLIVGPTTRLTQPLIRAVRSTGGTINRFNPGSGVFSPY